MMGLTDVGYTWVSFGWLKDLGRFGWVWLRLDGFGSRMCVDLGGFALIWLGLAGFD